MGPPVVQGAPSVPKMGVRARMSDLAQRTDVWDAQPPPRYDSLVQTFLNRPPHSDSLLKRSRDLQTGSETRYPLWDFVSHSPSRSLLRMKRSNSEVTISDIAAAEDLDPTAVNPNTGATLRREYGSTSTLDRQGPPGPGPMWTQRVEPQPSAPPPLLQPLLLNASLSPSLQTANQIARGDVVYVPGYDYVDASLFYSADGQRLPAERKKPQKAEASIFGRRRSRRRDGDHEQRRDGAATAQKCFAHYDVQSVVFSMIGHQSNTGPGGSGSGGAGQQQDLDPSEDGDGRSSGLVLSCPYFRNEVGGEAERRLGLTRPNSATCSEPAPGSRCTNAAVSVLEVCRENQVVPQNLMRSGDIEHVDLGAKYYLKYFYSRDHQNYFGVDETFGPVALSVRREKLEDENGTHNNYRIILRTSQLSCLRGSVLEDSVPSSSKHGTVRGLPLKDVLDFVVPELNSRCLRLAAGSPTVPELLLQLDQQELRFQFKVDILFCRAGQTSEEENYNNETSSPALDQFLDLLGHKHQLKGFTYGAQRDTTGDSTGSHSVYTSFRDYELMFHVSPLPPCRTQQMLRKHHVGDDVVMVIFQESEAPPFSPRDIPLHHQLVFIIVRVHRPCSPHTCYSVAVSRSRDVPSFGPLIPAARLFPASPAFRHFLLTKIINAHHAAHRSERFVTMATRQRQEHLRELVVKYSSSRPVDAASSSRFSFISLGGKKKERSTPRRHAHLHSDGALTWSVTATDFSRSVAAACRLAISKEWVVLIDEPSGQVLFNCYCRDVIGWSSGHAGVKLFYEHGDCVTFSTRGGNCEDAAEISQRLQLVSVGGPAAPMSLRRNSLGQLGFHVNFEGVVADVEARGFAWQAGLRPGCRLVEICGVAVVTLSHEQMIELLRTSATVTVLVIPPNRDGTPRRSFSEVYRVPIVEYKLQTDPTSHSFREAPPTSVISPNQSAAGTERPPAQMKVSSSFDTKEEPRMLQEFDSPPVMMFCRSPTNQSTSSDPGPSLPRHFRDRSAGLPDWSSSDEGMRSKLERTRSTETKWLPHHHHVTKVRGQYSSPAESNKQESEDKSCSCGSGSNTRSTNTLSSGGGDSEGLTCTERASTDSGIDSSACVSLDPVARATLVLRDVRGEGSEGEPTRGVAPATSAGHVTDVGHLSDTSSLSRLQLLLTTDLQFSSRPIREVLVRMMGSDVTASERPSSSASGVLPPSPWRSLTRAVSDDSLFRRTLSLASSRSSLRSAAASRCSTLPHRVGERLRGERSYSDSSLAERSKQAEDGVMTCPRAPSHLDWSYLVDAAKAIQGVFSADVHQERRGSAALQDSDITAASLSGKVVQLEEILRQLQLDLLKEQQAKVALQQQVLNLRQDNFRLQEESQSAADQIRKFTSWMLQGRTLP